MSSPNPQTAVAADACPTLYSREMATAEAGRIKWRAPRAWPVTLREERLCLPCGPTPISLRGGCRVGRLGCCSGRLSRWMAKRKPRCAADGQQSTPRSGKPGPGVAARERPRAPDSSPDRLRSATGMNDLSGTIREWIVPPCCDASEDKTTDGHRKRPPLQAGGCSLAPGRPRARSTGGAWTRRW